MILHERLFRELPLGARFKYKDGGPIWVVLERHECGLIAKWEGLNGSLTLQAICSAAESDVECASLVVCALPD